MMHGSGSTDFATGKIYTNFDAFADAHGLVVMYPQGIDKHWNDGRVIGHESMADDIGFMKAMLAQVIDGGLIDPKRVYAAGISNGGFMAQHMACVMPDALAGIAVVAASQPADAACPSPRPMPVIFFQGTADKFVPFNGGPIASQFGNRGTALSNAQAVAVWQKRNSFSAATRTHPPAPRFAAGNGRNLFMSGGARAGKRERRRRRAHLAGCSPGIRRHVNSRPRHRQHRRQRHHVVVLPVASPEALVM